MKLCVKLSSYSWVLLAILISTCEARPQKVNHERFDMKIEERGTEFLQEVDLEEEAEGIVAVHVPQHNDVDETYHITDTKNHLTMRVAPQQKMCFLTKNDPEELPAAEVWRKTRDAVQNNAINESKTKRKMMSYEITGSLNQRQRAALPQKMKHMCEGLPIVNVEPISQTPWEPKELPTTPKGVPFIDQTSTNEREIARFKRQLGMLFIDKCHHNRIAQKCVVNEDGSYIAMTCNTRVDANGREVTDCFKDGKVSDVRCCTPCCLDRVPEGNLSPHCDDLTEENICPASEHETSAQGPTRFKRQVDTETLGECNPARVVQRCALYPNVSYMVVDCSKRGPCTQTQHHETVRCCQPCCMDSMGDGSQLPYCNSLTRAPMDEMCPRQLVSVEDYDPIGQQTKRVKRQIDQSTVRVIDDCNPNRMGQQCLIFLNSCYYIKMCNATTDIQGREAAACVDQDHIFQNVRCCSPCCKDKVPEGNPSPYCYGELLTKEEYCPDINFAQDDPRNIPNNMSKLNGNQNSPSSMSKLHR